MLRRSFLMVLGLLFAGSTRAQEKASVEPKLWFVQFWTVPQDTQPAATANSVPYELYENEEPGRIEVFEGKDENNTVTCAQAKAVKGWNTDQIADISVGFTFYGDKDRLSFKAYGAVRRLMKVEIRITEKPVLPTH